MRCRPSRGILRLVPLSLPARHDGRVATRVGPCPLPQLSRRDHVERAHPLGDEHLWRALRLVRRLWLRRRRLRVLHRAVHCLRNLHAASRPTRCDARQGQRVQDTVQEGGRHVQARRRRAHDAHQLFRHRRPRAAPPHCPHPRLAWLQRGASHRPTALSPRARVDAARASGGERGALLLLALGLPHQPLRPSALQAIP